MIMPWWIGNIFAVIIFMAACFCILIAILNASFFKKHKRKMDMAILILGATGLIGMTADVRLQASELELKPYERWSFGATNPLRISLASEWECYGSVKTEFSPSNYDERVQAMESICSWQKEAFAKFNTIDFSKFPELPDIIKHGFPSDGKKIFPQFSKEHDSDVKVYEEFLSEVRNLQKRKKQSTFEVILHLLSPYLFALAIALSAAKIVREPL